MKRSRSASAARKRPNRKASARDATPTSILPKVLPGLMFCGGRMKDCPKDFPENPTVSISSGSTESQKRMAWDQIKKGDRMLARLLTDLKMLGPLGLKVRFL